MNQRFLTAVGTVALAIVVAAVVLAPSTVAGQIKSGSSAINLATARPADKPYVVPKTAEGKPDLQGYWTNNTYVPLERPNGVTKELYTRDEAIDAARKRAAAEEEQTTPGTTADVHYDFTQFGLDRSQTILAPNLRTALITSPANGKIPPLTAEGTKRAADRRAQGPAQGTQYDKVQNIVVGSRCIYQGGAPPMLPPGYNPAYQIVQGDGYVMFLIEAGHETRIVPTDGRPHAPEGVKSWLGDSKGRWEGNTLVVETTNFNDKVAVRGASEYLKVTERFTRVGDETIRYEFTMDDPHTWAAPWSAELMFTTMDGPIFEHACHEGNYGIMNTLAGVRAEEKKAAEAAAKKK